jgi:hypothetical protein
MIDFLKVLVLRLWLYLSEIFDMTSFDFDSDIFDWLYIIML